MEINPLGGCSKPDGASMQAAAQSGTARLHFKGKLCRCDGLVPPRESRRCRPCTYEVQLQM